MPCGRCACDALAYSSAVPAVDRHRYSCAALKQRACCARTMQALCPLCLHRTLIVTAVPAAQKHCNRHACSTEPVRVARCGVSSPSPLNSTPCTHACALRRLR